MNSNRPNTTDAEDALRFLIGLAEDSKTRMVDKQWKLPDQNNRQVPVRDRVEKVLKSIEKYACIVDVGIQHSPEIRLVYFIYTILYDYRKFNDLKVRLYGPAYALFFRSVILLPTKLVVVPILTVKLGISQSL